MFHSLTKEYIYIKITPVIGGCMNNKIVKMLCKYQSCNKIIDRNFILCTIEELIKEYKINKEVKIFKIIDNKDSSYSYYDRKIEINLNYERELNKTLLYETKSMLKKDSYIFLFNLLILESIYHEIEHAKQYKLVMSNKNNIESQILNLSFYHYVEEDTNKKNLQAYIKELEKQYNYQLDYYFCNPDERLAYIKSTNMIYKYAKELEKNRMVIDYLNYHRLENIVDEYEVRGNNIVSPIEKFFQTRIDASKKTKVNLIPFDEIIDIESLNKKCSLAQKFMYGFPISTKEYDLYNNIMKKTKTYSIINK